MSRPGTGPGRQRREYVVGRGDAARVAGAVQRFQAARPQFWVPILAAVVVLAVVGYSANGPATAIGGAAFIVVVSLLVVVLQRRKLSHVLLARGFRPGARIVTEFDDEQFTITAEKGSSTHTVDDITEVRVVRGIVLLRVRAARVVLALPTEVVPDASLHAFGTRP